MRLVTPNSDEKEALKVLFGVNNSHVSNFKQWLISCREGAIDNIKASVDADTVGRNIGSLEILDELIVLIERQ